MNKILSKLNSMMAIAFMMVICTASISANAQYGGNVITFGSSSSSSSSSSTSGSTTAPATNTISNCQSAQVTTNVSGTTLTANLCGVKAGNVININNLANTDIEALQITFDQDLNSGIFQIVKISESLTLPNLNGKYITAYELLTTNFNRTIIRNIKLTYKVSKSEVDKYTSFNAYTANSPWVNTNVIRETDNGSFARFTSVVVPFQQYALTGNAPLTTTTIPTATSSASLIGSTDLIRTGGTTTLLSFVTVSILTVLVLGSFYSTRIKNLNFELRNKSLLE